MVNAGTCTVARLRLLMPGAKTLNLSGTIARVALRSISKADSVLYTQLFDCALKLHRTHFTFARRYNTREAIYSRVQSLLSTRLQDLSTRVLTLPPGTVFKKRSVIPQRRLSEHLTPLTNNSINSLSLSLSSFAFHTYNLS